MAYSKYPRIGLPEGTVGYVQTINALVFILLAYRLSLQMDYLA